MERKEFKEVGGVSKQMGKKTYKRRERGKRIGEERTERKEGREGRRER